MYQVFPYDPQGDPEDYPFDIDDVGDQADTLCRRIRIGMGRDTRLATVVLHKDLVVGVVYSEVKPSGMSDGFDYDFHIAVAPEHQGGTVGYLLIKAAMKDWDPIADYCSTLVVHPVARDLLEKCFGFNIAEEHGAYGESKAWTMERSRFTESHIAIEPFPVAS